MAIETLVPTMRPWRVTTYVPNERETQVLGGYPAHAMASFDFVQTLRTFAARHGLSWVIQFENELRYPRTDGSTGTFYPDVQFLPGMRLGPYESYDVEAIGKPPALIVEILSRKTARRDVGLKLTAYAEMGVEEYVTFDPRPGRGLALHGYRLLRQGHYKEIPQTPTGGLWLSTLGLEVKAEAPVQPNEGPLLRLSTRDGEHLLHMDEEAEARITAEQGRDAAEEAREAAEQGYAAEVARLRALLAESERDPGSRHG